MIDTIYLDCNLASLISIRESREEYLVITKNPGFLGQAFRGVEIDGEYVPFGGTFLEFPGLEAASKDADVSEYSPRNLNSISQFSGLIFDYLSNFCELRILNKYTTKFNELSYPDFILGDSLKILEALDANKIKKQISSISQIDPHHPKNKNNFPFTIRASYETFSRQIYGNYFYETLLRPIKEKIIGNYDITCLKYHRANWLPLYWPDSILKYLNTGEDLKPYKFYSFKDYNFAQWTRKLSDYVEEECVVNDKALQIERNDSFFIITLGSGKRLHCRRVISALNITELNDILHFTDRNYDGGNSIFLAYLRNDRDEFDGLPEAQFVLDAENSIYRICRYSSHICVELSSKHLIKINDSERLSRVAADISAVIGTSISKEDIKFLREFKNARVNLSINNYLYHEELWRLNQKLGIDVTGSALGFGIGSIADQLVQGFQLAAYSK